MESFEWRERWSLHNIFTWKEFPDAGPTRAQGWGQQFLSFSKGSVLEMHALRIKMCPRPPGSPVSSRDTGGHATVTSEGAEGPGVWLEVPLPWHHWSQAHDTKDVWVSTAVATNLTTGNRLPDTSGRWVSRLPTVVPGVGGPVHLPVSGPSPVALSMGKKHAFFRTCAWRAQGRCAIPFVESLSALSCTWML